MIKRYDLTIDDDIDEMPDGEYYAKEDIDPILKVARVLAEEFIRGHEDVHGFKKDGCPCSPCGQARLILEKTEGIS